MYMYCEHTINSTIHINRIVHVHVHVHACQPNVCVHVHVQHVPSLLMGHILEKKMLNSIQEKKIV